MMKAGIWAVFMAALVVAAPVRADEAKDDAIARLVAEHDPAVPVAVGRLAVKQAGLGAARALLAKRGREAGLDKGWNANAPEWRAAEARLVPVIDGVIARQIQDPAWVRQVYTDLFASRLSAEEADEIATHFSTSMGREQRIVVEIKVTGELLMTNYTFTSRIDDGIRGSEPEYAQLQKVWADGEWRRPRNFDGDAGAQRFGARDPGIKYVKMLGMQGVEGMINHIDAVRAETVQAVAAANVDPFVESYRRRTAK